MCMPVKLGVRMYATYVNYLTLGGGALLPPIGVGNWCRRWGEQLATSGGGRVYISSCQHTEKKIGQENYVAWIALEPWLNACPCMPLTKVFQIGVEGIPPHLRGMGSFSGEGFNLYGGENLKRSDFDHSNLFQGQKLEYWTLNIELEYWT